MKYLIVMIMMIVNTVFADNLTLISLKGEHEALVHEVKEKYLAKRTVAGDRLNTIATKYRDLYLKKDRVDEAVYLSNVLTNKHKLNEGAEVPKEYADIKKKFDEFLTGLDLKESDEIKKIDAIYIKKCNDEIKVLIGYKNMADMREVKEYRDQLIAGNVHVEKTVESELHGTWIHDPTDSNPYQIVYIFTKTGDKIKWVRYIGSSESNKEKQAGKVKLDGEEPIIWGNTVTLLDANRIHIGTTSVDKGGLVITRLKDDSILRYVLD